MDYIEVSIRIAPFTEEASDIVTAEIDALGFESYMVEEPFLKAYIPQEKFSEQYLKTILSGFAHSQFEVEYSLQLIMQENWNLVWESSFEPVVVDGKCTIKAPEHKCPKTLFTININPKMAFGTGHHQTTCLMIEELFSIGGQGSDDGDPLSATNDLKKGLKGLQVLDMGCGTGILSILAAMMGAKIPVHAIDIDPVAVRSAKENARLNHQEDHIKILYGDASLIQKGKYDLLLANINRNILLEDISTYSVALKEGGRLIVSGFYERDIAMLREEGMRNGLEMVSQKTCEDWAAIWFSKKTN